MLYTKTYKGKFRTKNPLKYKGDVGNIVYRSLWELRFMKWCDQNISVQEWGSETVIVPYVSPLDKKVHRYFVDFYIKIKDKNGGIQKYLVEIKPERYTKPPSIPERKTKKFIDEVFQYGVNEAKWKAAFEFCQDRNMKFMVLTEKDLGLINGG
jgi:AAA+ ATPase superfamily predicted ATPase